MKRFRRKSEALSRGKDGRDRDPSSGTEEQTEQQAPPPLLPSLQRQSLILPHLTKRFSLLSGPDGKLVDLEVLNAALSERVKTRLLTTSEADAILHQFQLERGQQPEAPAVPRIRAQRLDWSLHQTEAEDGDESMRESLFCSSPSDQTTASFPDFAPTPSTFNSSTFGRSSNVSAIPFPHSPDSSASNKGSLSPNLGSTGSTFASGSHPYKRGGNSMFGGRVQNMAQMSRNKSSSSVASSSSRSAHTAAEDESLSAELDAVSKGTSLETREDRSVKNVEDAADEQGEAVGQESEDRVQDLGDQRSSVGASLSETQLKRISRVLDDIEQEIKGDSIRSSTPEDTTANSFARIPASPEGPSSDTEAMDPQLHHLAPSPSLPSLSTSRRPSVSSPIAEITNGERPASVASLPRAEIPTFGGPPPMLAPAVDPPQEQAAALEQPEDPAEGAKEEHEELEPAAAKYAAETEQLSAAAQVTPDEDGPRDGVEEGSASVPLPSPATSDDVSVITASPSTPNAVETARPVSANYVDLVPFPTSPDNRSTRSREVSNTPSDFTISPLSPSSVPSPPTSARSDLEQSFSDQDGPFDLSFGSTAGHGVLPEDEEQLEVVEEMSPQHKDASELARTKRHRRNISIVSSNGSSYHAAAEDHLSDNDDPLTTSSPQLQSLHVVSPTLPPHGEEDDEHLRAISESMDRRPSNELLETINSSSPALGEADLALEDLLMIQETLVRSASRRAAARKAGLLPNSPNERSDFGPRRGSGSDGAYSWSRKGSLEGSGSGSDGRRGSESDGKWGSGSDGRRGSDGVPAATQRRRSSGMESGLAPSAYRSSRATGTSATGSSPQTNGAPTPSSQSDAFEFSSLVGSPDSGPWDPKERLASPRQPEEQSPLVNEESPIINGDSPRSGFDSPNPSAFHSPISQAAASNDGHFQPETHIEAIDETEADAEVEAEAKEAVGPLGEPVKLGNDGFLRVPRSSRDPAKTQSVLIRDVRNQANLATIALKKTTPSNVPTSPVIRSKSLAKNKSIRKVAISSPQLVSGTSDIPSVPIVNPDVPSPAMSPKSPGRSASKKEKRDAEGYKSRSIGSRFKSLLKKPQNRDQLPQLNGDEVTPFETDQDHNLSPPFTPPDQSTATFTSPDHDRTPQQSDGSLDGRRSNDYLRTRSPAGLAAVAESPEVEQGSPSNSNSSGGTAGNKMSLTRLLSRKRAPSNRPRRESETSLAAGSGTDTGTTPDASRLGSPLERTDSPASSVGRRPSIEQEVFGLGLGPVHTDTSSRAPISYDIGSMRRRMGSESSSSGGHEPVPSTAPLAPAHRNPPQPLDLKHFSFPTNDKLPPASSNSQRGSGSTQHRHTQSNASDNSMRRLWEAAEDLGMPRDKVEELVNLSYAQSPTTSHTHSGSTSSTLGRQTDDSGEPPRPRKTSSTSHRRGLGSNTSNDSRQRDSSSGASSRKFEGSQGLTVNTGAAGGLVPGLRPPLSPSGDSFRSSGYAGSVFDLYGSEGSGGQDQEDEEDGEVVLKPGSIAFDSPNLGEEAPEEQPDLVWRVVDDLRRQSGVSSRSDSFGFNSRPSSTAGSTDGPDPLAQLLRHHARNRSSGSIPTPAARFPSVYEADEQRLMELGRQGGVADDAEGKFYTRPIDVLEEEARVERARRDSQQQEYYL